MPLKFFDDAIVLSGVTGTLIKTSIIAHYYKFWQSVVSGGEENKYKFPSTIIELNAGTSEVYIERIGHKTFGSAGHALYLKYGPEAGAEVENLTIILIEESPDCLKRLIKVILRRYPNVELMKAETEGQPFYYAKDMSLFIFDSYKRIPLKAFEERTLGNCLIYFDPLRATDWNIFEKIARHRIYKPYIEGTEFIVFLFTSDWIRGRGNFSPLSFNLNKKKLWSEDQKRTVKVADIKFGDRNWIDELKNGKTIDELESILVDYFRRKLQTFFRYIIPLPFSPKKNERYDLFFCTNHLKGATSIYGFYCSTFLKFFEDNFKYTLLPQEKEIFFKFKAYYPDVSQLNIRWKILWKIIQAYPNSVFDHFERSFREETRKSPVEIAQILEWLKNEGFLKYKHISNWFWKNHEEFSQYIVNWVIIEKRFGLKKPIEFQPIDPKKLKSTVIEIYDKREWPEEIIEYLEIKEEWELRRNGLLKLQGEPIERKKDCQYITRDCTYVECPIDDCYGYYENQVVCPSGLTCYNTECAICEDCIYLVEDLYPDEEPSYCDFFDGTIDDEEE